MLSIHCTIQGTYMCCVLLLVGDNSESKRVVTVTNQDLDSSGPDEVLLLPP